MKKVVRSLGIVVAGLLALVVVFVLVVIAHNAITTSYLTIPKNQVQERVVLKNVQVLPFTSDTVLPLQDVRIEGGVIKAIGSNLDTTNAFVVSGGGAYVMPGLIDMHVHVWDEHELALYLAHGITTVRNLWGFPFHLRLVAQTEQTPMYAAQIVTSSPKLTGPEFIGDDNLQLYSVAQAKQKVQEYKNRGYHYIKTYYGLTPELFYAILEQAEASTIEVVAHPTPKVPYSAHFHKTICSIEHAEDLVQQPLQYQLDSVKLLLIAQQFAEAKHGALCPTLMAYYNIYNMIVDSTILNRPEQLYMNPLIRITDSKDQFNRWQSTQAYNDSTEYKINQQHQFHLFSIKALHAAGVRIIAGTDAGIGVTAPGSSLHDELQFYKQAGLTNYEVLQTATVHAAQTHKNLANLGTVEVGKTANLMLLAANPLNNLEALKQPNYVLVNGQVVSSKKLKELKDQALNRNNLFITALRYAEFLWVEK